MTEPLDFSHMGRDKATAPPPPAPKRRRARGGMPKSLIVIVALVVAVGVAAVLIIRSRDDDSGKAAAAHQAQYCQSSMEFDLLASTTGAASASGTFDGPPPALAAFVSQTKSIVSDMKSVAPDNVDSDLDTVVAALTAASKGDRAALESPSFKAARDGLIGYKGTACPSGGESGEG
jgi:hypothetical protein